MWWYRLGSGRICRSSELVRPSESVDSVIRRCERWSARDISRNGGALAARGHRHFQRDLTANIDDLHAPHLSLERSRQAGDHACGSFKAVTRINCGRFVEPGIECFGQHHTVGTGPLRRGFDNAVDDGRHESVPRSVLGKLWTPIGDSYEQLERDLRDGIQVCGRTDVAVSEDLLGRHISWSTNGAGVLRPVATTGNDLGDAEVEDANVGRTVIAPAQEEILRLEIAVNDARRMRLVEGQGGLGQKCDGQIRLEGPLLLRDLAKVATFEQIHHHEGGGTDAIDSRIDD